MAPLLMPAAAVFVLATLGRWVTFALVLKQLSVAACPSAPKQQRKFREAAWRGCLYMLACGWVVKCSLIGDDMPWLRASEHFWKGWPEHEVSSEISSLYALYVGLYTHQLLFLFCDTRSSDFVALVAHHMITLTIVTLSWTAGFTRVGSFVMMCVPPSHHPTPHTHSYTRVRRLAACTCTCSPPCLLSCCEDARVHARDACMAHVPPCVTSARPSARTAFV
jgi:ceramide synthetase